MTESDPISIVRRIRDRDSAATQEVLQRVRRILAYRGYGIPEEDRRELEGVVITQIWSAIRRPGFDEAGFWGFVEVVASRRSIDWLRLSKTEIRLEEAGELTDPGPGPLGSLLQREKRELAQEILGQLPAACRRLIELVTGEHKTYREAARVLGKSEGALRVQMFRCIREARELLAGTARRKKSPEDL